MPFSSGVNPHGRIPLCAVIRSVTASVSRRPRSLKGASGVSVSGGAAGRGMGERADTRVVDAPAIARHLVVVRIDTVTKCPLISPFAVSTR